MNRIPSNKGNKVFIFLATLFCVTTADANPVLDNVAAGNINITQSPGQTTVEQTSSKAIINWQSFNIGAGERTHFQQPVNGIALNRISPTQGPSQIFGALTATGKIILINQAGVYFGPTAHVDVAGLMVSTANITDENFLGGRYIFDQASGNRGSVINEGSIKVADYGMAALMGTSVVNNGVIEAHLGNVVLASGSTFTMDFMGDHLINFTVGQAITKKGLDQNGKELNNGVSNKGVLIADGGKVLLTGRAAQGVVDDVVNMQGIAQARSVKEAGGVIILDGNDGAVEVAGKLDASGPGTKGGTVKVLAKNVHVKSTAIIDASGDKGGGEILIGGNYQGKGPEANAWDTTVDSGALLNARANVNGDGGKVIVWADNDTQFHGKILAQGGIEDGNGGFVETSGHYLDIKDSSVSTQATHGAVGTWLLDPADLTIGSSGNSNVTGSSPFSAAGAGNSTLDVSTLLAALASTNVIVQTTNTGSGGNGDIFVNTAITWSSGNNLTLSAYRNITLNSNITNTTLSGAGLTLLADNTGIGTGTVINNATINMSTGGAVKIFYNPSAYTTPTAYTNAGTDPLTAYMLVNNATNLQSMNTNLSGNYGLTKNINASGVAFVPVGSTGTPYTGNFDGQGYQISSLNIDAAANDVGLFGATSGSATISDVGISGTIKGNGFANVGSLVGNNAGTITDTYNYASVVGGAGADSVGGLVGKNSGTINTSYSIGYVDGAGATNVGGLVGSGSGTAATGYWDTQSSGQATSAGYTPGVNNLSTAALKSLPATFSPSVWGILPGTSYPYLLASHPTAPRVISGQIATFNTVASATNPNVFIPQWPPIPDALSNATVTLAVDGAIVDKTQSGANGSYYFLESGTAVSDNIPLLTYLSSGGKSTAITLAPTAGRSITSLYLPLNAVFLADNGDPNNASVSYAVDNTVLNPLKPYLVNFITSQVTEINNQAIAQAIGGIADSNILYTANTALGATDIDVATGYDFITAPHTLYGLTGNLSTTQADIIFKGPVLEGALDSSYGGKVNVETKISGNIVNDNTITWRPGTLADPNIDIIHLISAQNIVLNAPILGMWWTGTGGTGAYDHRLRGSIELSAAYTDKSITTGPSGTITVYDFKLDQGKWWQVVPRYTTYGGQQLDTLPYFQVSYAGGTPLPFSVPLYAFLAANEFSIADGMLPSTVAEYIRAAYDPAKVDPIGTPNNPFLIEGIYGLQGIASSSYTLAASYKQIQNIGLFNDGVVPFFWNGGNGFVPIGDGPGGVRGQVQIGFSGNYDGDGYATFLYSGWGEDYAGMFGYTTPTATITNMPLLTTIIYGNDYTGGLVGYNEGQITKVNVGAGTNVYGNDYVGGIAGYNTGSIKNSAYTASSVEANDYAGGIAGYNSGVIDKTLSVPFILANSHIGGIAGANTGIISNSFWDTDYSGVSNAVGSNIGALINNTGGCFGGNCTNGGTVDLTLQSTYAPANWDFTSDWNILPGTTSYVQTANGLVPFSKNLSYPYTIPIATGYFYSAYVNGVLTTIMDPTLPHYLPSNNVLQVASGYLTGLPTSESAYQLVSATYGVAGSTPSFAANTPTINAVFGLSGANGFYYAYGNPGIIPDGVTVTTVVVGPASSNAPINGGVTYRQPINGGSVSGINFPVASGASTDPTLLNLLQGINAIFLGKGINASQGFASSLVGSQSLYLNVINSLNSYSVTYWNLIFYGVDSSVIKNTDLLSACSNLYSQACQDALAKTENAMTPSGNINLLINKEIQKDDIIKAKDEFVPKSCL